KNQAFRSLQSFAQYLEITTTGLYNIIQLLKLGATDGRLHVCHFQIKAEMAVYIFVVVTRRQLTELACETALARIVHTAHTPAVAPPVTERADYLVQFGIICIDCTALAHGHVV